jgi:multidrug efflux pump subunit AcrB
MGIVYLVGLILIYMLAVGQLRSYALPLIVMMPIPFTIIGALLGHVLLGLEFTAASMIGVIALAGLDVGSSTLLVDFVRRELARGVALEEAVIRSVSVRTKPIVLTSLAAMLGAFFMLDDPVFRGLAVALILGIVVSTVLTLVVTPVLFYAAAQRRQTRGRPAARSRIRA